MDLLRPRRPQSVFVNICGRFEIQNIINLNMCHPPGDYTAPSLFDQCKQRGGDTAPLFVYTDQLLCHCILICSNVR